MTKSDIICQAGLCNISCTICCKHSWQNSAKQSADGNYPCFFIYLFIYFSWEMCFAGFISISARHEAVCEIVSSVITDRFTLQ